MQKLVESSCGLGGTRLGNLFRAELLLSKGLSIRIKSEHDLLVLKRVLLEHVLSLLSLVTSGSDDTLDFRRVDNAGDVGVGDDVGRKGEAGLGRGVGLGSPDLKQAKGRFGPDHEPAKVGTRSKLEQVEGADVRGLDTRNVSECLDKALVFAVDDQGSSSLGVTAASQLTLTGTGLLGLDDLDNVSVGADGL